MGYFKGVVSLNFKKDVCGKTLFYPYGIFGKRFIIESKDKANQIQEELIKQTKRDFLLFFSHIFLSFLPTFIKVNTAIFYCSYMLLGFAIFALTYLKYKNYISKVTQNLKKPNKQTRKEYIGDIFEKWKNAALHHNFFVLYFLGLIFPLCGYITFKYCASFVSVLFSLIIQLICFPVILLIRSLLSIDLYSPLFFDFTDIVIIQPIIETIFCGTLSLFYYRSWLYDDSKNPKQMESAYNKVIFTLFFLC